MSKISEVGHLLTEENPVERMYCFLRQITIRRLRGCTVALIPPAEYPSNRCLMDSRPRRIDVPPRPGESSCTEHRRPKLYTTRCLDILALYWQWPLTLKTLGFPTMLLEDRKISFLGRPDSYRSKSRRCLISGFLDISSHNYQEFEMCRPSNVEALHL